MTTRTVECDFLVVGSGVAGLRAAMELSRWGDVVLATKAQPAESNSAYAQGGVAVALADDDEPALHLEDTIRAGDGIVLEPAARVLVEEGPERLRELVAWGARFDHADGRVQFTREAAHSRNRVLHALGDATGWELVRALLEKARGAARIKVHAFACATDLLLDDAREHVVGARFLGGEQAQDVVDVRCRATLLATGGFGQLYAETTNPTVATGDGVAMALRAGAALADMEFVQFHPTALAIGATPRFLISEAVRGEGAYLRNHAGERFTDELAPRDQVARAIDREYREGRGPVGLDLRHLETERVRARFPRIVATCARHELDPAQHLIPVRPAAHYAMGGVATDLDGRTTLRALYAAGEVACTGVHGANRLASNSLLEGLVFGVRAARAMASDAWGSPGKAGAPDDASGMQSFAEATEEEAAIRSRAWLDVGLLRDGERLQSLLTWLAELATRRGRPATREAAEARNLVDVGRAVASCALFRRESRGGHYRCDHERRDDDRFGGHTLLQADGARLVRPLRSMTEVVA